MVSHPSIPVRRFTFVPLTEPRRKRRPAQPASLTLWLWIAAGWLLVVLVVVAVILR